MCACGWARSRHWRDREGFGGAGLRVRGAGGWRQDGMGGEGEHLEEGAGEIGVPRHSEVKVIDLEVMGHGCLAGWVWGAVVAAGGCGGVVGGADVVGVRGGACGAVAMRQGRAGTCGSCARTSRRGSSGSASGRGCDDVGEAGGRAARTGGAARMWRLLEIGSGWRGSGGSGSSRAAVLALRFGVIDRQANARVARLAHDGLVVVHREFVGQASAIYLVARGQHPARAADRGGRRGRTCSARTSWRSPVLLLELERGGTCGRCTS